MTGCRSSPRRTVLADFTDWGLRPRGARRFVSYLLGTLGTAVTLLQNNAAVFNAFWPYLTGIVVQLIAVAPLWV